MCLCLCVYMCKCLCLFVYVCACVSVCVQSNLSTTATLGTQNLWPLLTVGRCSEVPLYYRQGKRGRSIVVAVGSRSLFRGV